MFKTTCPRCEKEIGIAHPNGSVASICLDINKKVRFLPRKAQTAKQSYAVTTKGEKGVWGEIDTGKRKKGATSCYRPHYLTCTRDPYTQGDH